MILPLLLSGMWAGLLLGLAVRLPRHWPWPAPELPAATVWVAAVALLARLVPAGLLLRVSNFDIESYRLVAGLVNQHVNVYSAESVLTRHPYLPLQMYWMAGAARLATASGWPFEFVVKLAPILADAGLALVLYRLLLRRTGSPRVAWLTGLAYALHPVAVFVSAYHGQFDALPLLATVLAVAASATSAPAAGWWLGLGLLDKSWPVIFLPSFLVALKDWRRRAWFLAAVAAVPLAGVLAYYAAFGADPVTVVLRAIGYNHGIGIWGYTYLARLLYESPLRFDLVFGWAIRYGRYLTLLGLGLVWVWRARREALSAGLLTLTVAFLALTHAFSIQYLVWVVPLAILEADHVWLRRFTLAAFAYMLLAYLTLILGLHITAVMPWPQADLWLIIPAGLPAWLVCMGWLVARFRGNRAATAAQPREGVRPTGVSQPEPR